MPAEEGTERQKMIIALSVISFLAVIAGVLAICRICKNNMEKQRNGKTVSGRKISCKEIWGSPIRYIVEVECQIKGEVNIRRFVTTNKKIKRFEDNETIPLLYVDSTDQVYWDVDDTREWIVLIIFLALVVGFMFMLSGICFMLYLGTVL